MLRGHRTYLSLFKSEVAESIAIPERKGRSEELICRRNELLIHRYYFFAKIKGLQYHRILKSLEEEMFITQRTISNIVQQPDYNVMLKNLHKTGPQAKYFAVKYPHLNWGL